MDKEIKAKVAKVKEGVAAKNTLLNTANKKTLIAVVRAIGLKNWERLVAEFKLAIVANEYKPLDRYMFGGHRARVIDVEKPEILEAELLDYYNMNERDPMTFSAEEIRELLLTKELGVITANKHLKQEQVKTRIAYLELALAKTLSEITQNESK